MAKFKRILSLLLVLIMLFGFGTEPLAVLTAHAENETAEPAADGQDNDGGASVEDGADRSPAESAGASDGEPAASQTSDPTESAEPAASQTSEGEESESGSAERLGESAAEEPADGEAETAETAESGDETESVESGDETESVGDDAESSDAEASDKAETADDKADGSDVESGSAEPEDRVFRTAYTVIIVPGDEELSFCRTAIRDGLELPVREDGELTLAEAWSFLESDELNARVQIVKTPELAEGEELMLVGLKHQWLDAEGRSVEDDDETRAELRFSAAPALMRRDVRPDDWADVDTAKYDGFALLVFTPFERKAADDTLADDEALNDEGTETTDAAEAPEDDEPEAPAVEIELRDYAEDDALRANENIYLTGRMPVDAVATAVPVELEIDGMQILAAYDITIYADAEALTAGKEWQPENGTVTVRFLDAAFENADEVDVYHIPEADAEPELIATVAPDEEGGISFDAPGFSVYVVIDHENETAVSPRVMFHFISNLGVVSHSSGGTAYYEGTPYTFKNTNGDDQTTQILSDGESLELIKDPVNEATNFFFGWYVVEPYVIPGTTDDYGIGLSDSKLYYTWPEHPDAITFESPLSITGDVTVGGTTDWSLNSATGEDLTVDEDGNVHVFLAPVFDQYNFVNFMLRAKGDPKNSMMTRKLIAKGSASSVEVEISDIRSNSTDPVHLVFIGWEYDENAGTGDPENWIRIPTVDYSGAELKETGKDGTYLTVDLADKSSIDLYPIFVEARWVDFVAGVTGSGATYVASRFLESWGSPPPPGMTEEDGKNAFTSLSVPTRPGYSFAGWYAFAVTDPQGRILNLTTPMDVTFKYVNTNNKFETRSVTINTTAVQITDGSGTVVYNGDYSISTINGTEELFSGYVVSDSTSALYQERVLIFHDALDRLSLTANWTPGTTNFTIVYWTENAQDQGYVPSTNVEDTYSANLARVFTTEELNDLFYAYNGTRPAASGVTITYEDLAALGLLSTDNLAGAVPDGEEIFYELVPKTTVIGLDADSNDVYPDASKTIAGDGQTVFNVYYDRMTFKLVFHLGHDGYVKNHGQMKNASYPSWDGNWIQYMYKDAAVTALGYTNAPGGSVGDSYVGSFSMTYNGGTPGDPSDDVMATSNYVATNANVMGNYVPSAGEDLYVIEAKYGAYIGDRWPSRVNPNFSFTDESDPGKSGYMKTLYIWTAYYKSLYAGIANARPNELNSNGNNSDINGIYEYMSKELCANRAGTAVIDNRVHHLVAYFGEGNPSNNLYKNRFKQYHIMIEAIDGTYDPGAVTLTSGSYYAQYALTTWSREELNKIARGEQSNYIDVTTAGGSYYEDRVSPVISNLQPEYQLGWDLDGYDLVYSCYDSVKHSSTTFPGETEYDIYFFYRPKQFTLTFMYNDARGRLEDTYYYTQSLGHALEDHGSHDHSDPVMEGYTFQGWYTNEAGEGDHFAFEADPAPTMPAHNVVLYPRLDVIKNVVRIDPNGGVIDHIRYDDTVEADYYGLYATDFGVTGSGYVKGQSTYFNADYGTPIGEYTVVREYIQLTDDEKTSYTGTRYYYVNTQFDGINDGDWGLPPDLRNAVYLTESQLHAYHDYYTAVATANLGYYTGVNVMNFADFAAAYTSYPDSPYRPVGAEEYTFMGWFQVYDDGSVDSMPYNFNDPAVGPLTLRALWRLEGGYYIRYNPYFVTDDNGAAFEINGTMSQWFDPEDPTLQLYADQSPTHVLQAPTNLTATDWVFRGWCVVRETTQTIGGSTYTVGVPIQLDAHGDPIYYQPGDAFTVDSSLATESDVNAMIIHMAAFYEPESTTTRRPEVTNLTLDANGGTVNTSGALAPLELPGSVGFSGTTQIEFGDFQSNAAIHLQDYAPLFSHPSGYLLLGFDDAYDENDYIATYPADSVISVQRTDDETVYAVWEPMVYVTFVNTTDEDITVDLSGTGASTVSVVNIATGAFDREQVTGQIVVPANDGVRDGMVKIVLPGAIAGVDSFTASAINDHSGKLMSVSGEYPAGTDYGTGHEDVPEGYPVNYTAVLVTDADGIVVTYTETDVPVPRVYFDMNGGTTWTETNPLYLDLTGTGELYYITKDDITNNNGGNYEPSDPAYTGMVFVGWTDNADVAALTDFSAKTPLTSGSTTITPPSGGNVLDKVRSDFLWDFSQTLDPTGDLTLYAVWSLPVTVTFDLTYTDAANLHNWTGPATTATPGTNVYYRSDASSASVTYTMAKGDRVPEPSDPTANAGLSGYFFKWLTSNATTNPLRNSLIRTTNSSTDKANFITYNSYAFDFTERVLSDVTLVTSWLANQPQVFTFTIENNVVNGFSPDDEFDYTIAISGEQFNQSGNVRTPSPAWGSVTTSLKDNETYTVRVTTSYIYPGWFGYCVTIDVIDRSGAVIKSGNVMVRSGQSYSGFTSDYMYTLTVTQDAKTGYETTVDIVSSDMTGDEAHSITRSYTFQAIHRTTTTGGNASKFAGFEPQMNGYVAGGSDSAHVLFTNTNPEALARLTVTKTVTGEFADHTKDFSFTLTSVQDEAPGAAYEWQKISGGASTFGTIHTGESFTLKHGESFIVAVPLSKQVVITETTEASSTSWQFNSSAVQSGSVATVALTADSTLAFTNVMLAPSPTGLRFHAAPFALMLLGGLCLLPIAGRRRRKEDEG